MEAEKRGRLISEGIDAFALMMVFGSVTRQNVGGPSGESLHNSLSMLSGRMMAVLDEALEMTPEESIECAHKAKARADEFAGNFSVFADRMRATMAAPMGVPN